MQTKPAPSSPTQCPYIELQVIRLMHTTLADRGARWHKSALCHNSHTMLLSLPARQSNTACLHSTANPPHTVTNLPTHSTERKTLIRFLWTHKKTFWWLFSFFFFLFWVFFSTCCKRFKHPRKREKKNQSPQSNNETIAHSNPKPKPIHLTEGSIIIVIIHHTHTLCVSICLSLCLSIRAWLMQTKDWVLQILTKTNNNKSK